MDFSFSHGNSVNDRVSDSTSTLSYVEVWDAAREIMRLGRGTGRQKWISRMPECSSTPQRQVASGHEVEGGTVC